MLQNTYIDAPQSLVFHGYSVISEQQVYTIMMPDNHGRIYQVFSQSLAKPPLKFNVGLAKHGLTSLARYW